MRRRFLAWITLAAGAVCATGSEPVPTAAAQQVPTANGYPEQRPASPTSLPMTLSAEIITTLPGNTRRVLDKPTLCVRGPSELFRGRAALYDWLLDHPDQAVLIWRRLGAKCMDIDNQGSGCFGWNDGQGSTIHWQTVYRDNHLRIWYAEGSAKPSVLLPTVPARAVVVLHIARESDTYGKTLLRHQAEIYLQTDSKSTLILARLLGASVPRMADQAIGQLEIFFSALTWYLDRHPDRAEGLVPPELVFPAER